MSTCKCGQRKLLGRDTAYLEAKRHESIVSFWRNSLMGAKQEIRNITQAYREQVVISDRLKEEISFYKKDIQFLYKELDATGSTIDKMEQELTRLRSCSDAMSDYYSRS